MPSRLKPNGDFINFKLYEMIKFNPENKKTLTIGECLDPAMEIKDPKEAEEYKKEYIKSIQVFLDKEPRKDGRTAESIVNENIGYWSGYRNMDVQKRVQELFKTKHPVFGEIKE